MTQAWYSQDLLSWIDLIGNGRIRKILAVIQDLHLVTWMINWKLTFDVLSICVIILKFFWLNFLYIFNSIQDKEFNSIQDIGLCDLLTFIKMLFKAIIFTWMLLDLLRTHSDFLCWWALLYQFAFVSFISEELSHQLEWILKLLS